LFLLLSDLFNVTEIFDADLGPLKSQLFQLIHCKFIAHGDVSGCRSNEIIEREDGDFLIGSTFLQGALKHLPGNLLKSSEYLSGKGINGEDVRIIQVVNVIDSIVAGKADVRIGALIHRRKVNGILRIAFRIIRRINRGGLNRNSMK
jgi:hypothetical protein